MSKRDTGEWDQSPSGIAARATEKKKPEYEKEITEKERLRLNFIRETRLSLKRQRERVERGEIKHFDALDESNYSAKYKYLESDEYSYLKYPVGSPEAKREKMLYTETQKLIEEKGSIPKEKETIVYTQVRENVDLEPVKARVLGNIKSIRSKAEDSEPSLGSRIKSWLKK